MENSDLLVKTQKNLENVSQQATISKKTQRSKTNTKRLKHKRSWIYTKFGKKNRVKTVFCFPCVCVKEMSKQIKFSLASYNLLAPALATENQYLYYNVKNEHLNWNYRRITLLNEIRYHNSDIYCFQEMQKDQYYEYFYPQLKQLGYYCLYKKRTGDKPDGCCIVFKRNKFQLISSEAVEYNQGDIDTLNKDNVALIVLLQPKHGPTHERLCVATTHIIFSPKRGDIKLAQMQTLLANIDRIAFKKVEKTKTGRLKHIYHPIILCGDMNSVCDSPFIDFMTKSKLLNYVRFNRTEISGQLKRSSGSLLKAPLIPKDFNITDQSQFKHELDKRISSLCAKQEEIEEVLEKIDLSFGTQHLYHPFKFKSAYEYCDKHGNEFVTTCLPDSHESVDFIFYHVNNNKQKKSNQTTVCDSYAGTSNSNLQSNDDDDGEDDEDRNYDCEMKILSTLQLFTKEQVESVYLPNQYFASDHFLLAVEFLLISKN